MEECIFCIQERINKKGIIFSDNDYYIMLDKFPSCYGHLLVISKQHFENFLETPDNIITQIMLAAKQFGIILKKVLFADGISVKINIGKEADQLIMHTHIHIIPKYKDPKIYEDFKRHSEINEEYISEIKSKILKELSNNST